MAKFTKRGLAEVVFLTLVTLGFYQIYWTVITKRELNRAGADIPSAFLMIIPLVHFYFWYLYTQNYVKIVLKSDNETDLLVYFLLACLSLPFFPLLRLVIFQNGFNKYHEAN